MKTFKQFQEGIMPTTLKGAVVRGAVGAAAGALAKKGLDKAKEKVDDAIGTQRKTSPIGGDRRSGQ